MLILPLHRPLTAATFPYATALLIVLNVLVFFGLQAGDDDRLEAAARFYDAAALHEVELPAYLAWRRAHALPAPTPDARAGMPPSVQAAVWIQQDPAFLADLRADRVITPADDAYAAWKPQRAQFDRLWDADFTQRHVLRFSELDGGRMVAAMFLHGGVGHLAGNMVFLALLGLLVEGALGSRQFLAVYLLGGLGGQLASLAFRWGDTGSALGASGAIAALMGAFCVLWGTRPVRVFVWFFVVFDYLRVRALWLLPVWLGWEVLNLAFNDGAGIGFDAHAGGIASGALLGWIVVRLGRERRDFMAEPVAPPGGDDALPRALAHLAKLEIAQARALLAPIVAGDAAPFAARVAWYRCSRYDPARTGLHDAALRALRQPVAGPDRAERARVLEDYLQACGGRPGFDVAVVPALARAWLEADADEDAERLLRAITTPGAADVPGLPEAWLQLARHLQGRNDRARAQAACVLVQQHFPGTPAAAKAAFLQSAGS